MQDSWLHQVESARRDRPRLRIILSVLILLPAFLFGALQVVAAPDLETWLIERTQGAFRNDAFDHVNRIAPLFSAALILASALACSLVALKQFRFLLPLASGPLLALAVYLLTNGLTDPAWFSLLAILTVFLVVSSSVTLIYALVSRIVTSRTQHSTDS